MNTAIKICGLNDEISVRSVIKSGADFAGFVHYPKSPRHISIELASKLKSLLPATIKSVAVMVNPDDSLLSDIKSKMQPDFFQLHGNETAQRVQEIRNNFPDTAIIKAIAVREYSDVEKAACFYGIIDYILFDAKPASGMIEGGNGIVFDWSLLAGKTIPEKWFLSGGLNSKNIKEAIVQTGAKFVDVSSGVEDSPGVKNPTLIEKFIKMAR